MHETFRRFLRKHALKRINFKKKKLLTKEQHDSYENAKTCYICKKKSENNYFTDKKHRNVSYHCHYTGEYIGAAHSIYNLKYSVPKNIPIIFKNVSKYDYLFIVKELEEEFKKQFTSLGENTGKYITFTVPIEKEITRIDKNGEEITKNITYILHSIDSVRFMVSLLSLSVIFPKEFTKLNVNTDIKIKNVNFVELNINIATVFSNIQTLKMI